MNSTKFHQLVTKTGNISLAALAVIGILATFFVVCEIDLDFLPEFLEKIFFFILSDIYFNISYSKKLLIFLVNSQIVSNLAIRRTSCPR